MAITKGFQNDNRAPTGNTRESLWPIMTQIRIDETFVSSTAPTVKVNDQIHMWSTKTPRTIASRSLAQGGVPTADNSDTARTSNWTQIIYADYQLTGSRMAADVVGKDVKAQERDEAMNDCKDFLEYDLVRGTMVCGNNSTPSKMKGLKAFASTLLTSASSASFSETAMNKYMGNAWAVGTKTTNFLVGQTIKDRINGFSGGANKNVDASTESLYGNIDVIKTSYGTVKINLHRYITADTDSTKPCFCAYDPRYIHLGEYRPFVFEPLAKVADADEEMCIGEYTLQVDTEKAVLLVTDLL